MHICLDRRPPSQTESFISFDLSIYLFISIYLYIYISIYLYIYISIYLYIYISIYMKCTFVSIEDHLVKLIASFHSIDLSIYLYLYLYIYIYTGHSESLRRLRLIFNISILRSIPRLSL